MLKTEARQSNGSPLSPKKSRQTTLMHARMLQTPRPPDVAVLVEARLEFDEHCDLSAQSLAPVRACTTGGCRPA